jgi:hypothetical protein
MTRTLVLTPDLPFADLCTRLREAAWHLVGSAKNAIVVGEPEHALFERGGADRIFYSFNPVCRLRLLDGPAAADAVVLVALPTVDADTVGAWLTSTDERTVLRGILAAVPIGDPALLPALDAHRRHARAAIARAAGRASDELRSRSVAAPDARVHAIAAIELLRQHLAPLLHALAEDSDGSLAASLRPRPEDFDCAFEPTAAVEAREAYAGAWPRDAPRVGSVRPGDELRIDLAPAGMLADDNALSRHFPSGYRSIAHRLDPHRVWVRWKYVRPGESAGMSYDGLVWLDDRWVWFPKPYRMLAPKSGGRA